ncbi:MAG: hypothetical protein IPG39_03660 [Bacteroidetes bacterium]|nr:hypothetical protein [Bacteroidota bacterium]
MQIKNKFVIILGAGSSMEYGYPSGLKLQEIIIRRSKPIDRAIKPEHRFIYYKDYSNGALYMHPNENDYYEELKSAFPTKLVDEFSQKLAIIDAPSIDAFISMPINAKFIDICKFTIVQTILSYEKTKLYEERKVSTKKLHHMLFPVNSNTIDFSNLTFISFSFDRSFEHYFLKKIFTLCNGDAEIAYEQFKKIKIYHPYGMVNEAVLPPKKYKTSWFSYGQLKEMVGYKNSHYKSEAELIRDLSCNIDTIYESRESKEHAEIKNEIDNAEAFIFLGFGYHESNLKLLNIKSGHLFGTSFELSKQQHLKLKQLFPNIQLQPYKVSDYMLKHVPFNDI